VSTSDHETGGLAAARQLHKTYPDYLWYPRVLANAKHSSEYAGNKLNAYTSGEGKDKDNKKKATYIRDTILKQDLGITDVSDEEIESLINPDVSTSYIFADMISRRAQIGWSTHGHSGKKSFHAS
jgi:alkaline phosphatase